MATEDAIREVTEMLGADAGSSGWTPERIGADLDAGKTPNKIALMWWGYRAANTTSLVNVSESGSSRSLGDIHAHAMSMWKMYQDLVAKEEEEVAVVVPPTVTTRGPGIYTHPIRRIART